MAQRSIYSMESCWCLNFAPVYQDLNFGTKLVESLQNLLSI